MPITTGPVNYNRVFQFVERSNKVCQADVVKTIDCTNSMLNQRAICLEKRN